VPQLEQLEVQYREHHRSARAPDFVFARPERTELFRRYVGGPGQRVLDVGCRSGALTSTYLQGNEIVGIDVDREALAQAAERGIETHWADVERPLPFEDERFDVVVLGEVLEHVRDPSALVAESWRVLRALGTLVGSVPNVFRLKNRLLFLAGRNPVDDSTMLKLLGPDDVRALLRDFDEVELHFLASRFIRWSPRLAANVIGFSALKPS
jgi:methionine biosynthesis protein MetW